MKYDLIKTIGNGIAVAMGVAVVVTNLVNPLTLANATTQLGIGLVALGIAALKK